MHTYQVMIPFNRNADRQGRPGKPYLVEGERWENWLLKEFGGFTRLSTATGMWRDPTTGTVFTDAMIPYQIAVANQWDVEKIAEKALRIFDDQHAIYVTSLGASHIFDRANIMAAAE